LAQAAAAVVVETSILVVLIHAEQAILCRTRRSPLQRWDGRARKQRWCRRRAAAVTVVPMWRSCKGGERPVPEGRAT
tara:strand:+ start:445 stop:675 length:231 start_codon:yes stop_codon:yes gene_type:complete